MFDEVFGEVTLDYDEYVAKKEIIFFGEKLKIDVYIKVDEDETIKPIQCDAYEALMQNWEELQHKIADAILEYYNEKEKEAYGPDDEEEIAEWWPDIDSEEELVNRIHLDTIIVPADYIMEIKGENPVFILFNCDWGGEDIEDNGVAVLIEDGDVSEVGYKDIAY